jgi:4'-phosphopantetheinyl transferase
LTPELEIWVMRVDGLDEEAVRPWAVLLDEAEKNRVARFMFARNRVEFTAAHVLTRQALSAATGARAAAFRFEAGEHGKPTAWIGGERAKIHFNLSHTEGLVAVAVAPFEQGLDVEPLDRRVDLAVADRFFCPEEIDWLNGLPEAEQAEGFLRLWTLKEAFIKATGRGLSEGLDTFWFEVFPPSLHFVDARAKDSAPWVFEQRVIDGQFIAAAGFRTPPGSAPLVDWRQVDPATLSPMTPPAPIRLA